MATNLTQEDILEAIRLALRDTPDSSDGMTVNEFVEKTRATRSPLSPMMIRRAIRALIQEGTMEPCRVRRLRLDGSMALVGGYRLKT